MANGIKGPYTPLNGYLGGLIVPLILGALVSYAGTMTVLGSRLTRLEATVGVGPQAVPRDELEPRIMLLSDRIRELEALHPRTREVK